MSTFAMEDREPRSQSFPIENCEEDFQQQIKIIKWLILSGKFIISVLSVFVILLCGGLLCHKVIPSIIALGYMSIAMKKTIENNGKFCLPGQQDLKKLLIVLFFMWVCIAIPLTVVRFGAFFHLIAAIGLIVAFIMCVIGAFAVLRGAAPQTIFYPKNSWKVLHNNPLEQNFTTKNILQHIVSLWKWGVMTYLGIYTLLFVPSFLMSIGWTMGWLFSFERLTSEAAFFGFLTFLGMVLFTWVVIYLPMAIARFVDEQKFSVLWQIKENKELIRSIPVYYSGILLATFLIILFPHALRIERLRVENVGFICFVYFCCILWCKLLWSKAYTRAKSCKESPKKRYLYLGKLLALIVGGASTFIAIISQFISWRGAYGFFDHFVYLLPTPF